MKSSNSVRIWLWVLAIIAFSCLAIGFGSIIAAYAENGGCEVGGFKPDGQGWQPCSSVNPTLVWGAVLAIIGVLFAGLTAAVGAITAAILARLSLVTETAISE